MGVVNIFLGGTGKYLAEELKGLRAHYGLPLPDFIAFDLSRATTHTGAFTLGHDLLVPHEQFASTTLDHTAPDWVDLDAGGKLGPERPVPGPEHRPEVDVMNRIALQASELEPPAEGLWGLRAAGLLAFATFMSPDAEGPEAEAVDRFKNRVKGALISAGQGGSQITVNVVASTAGGTGAGMFMPFAWWLLDHPNASRIEINLILVGPSAFENEALDGGTLKTEMITKGRSGTFAIIRELELLEQADVHSTVAERHFPIPSGNPSGVLAYRLGKRPFHRVYWIGKRSVDGEATKADVYREMDPFVRILSNESAADDLDGFTGTHPQRLLPSVVTVDYPRLPLARRMSSDLAEEAIQRLVDGESAPGAGRRFFEFPGDQPGAFGKFLQVNENRALAANTGGDTNTSVQEYDELVEAYTDVKPHRLDYTGIATGTARVRAGYSAPDEDWRAYCASLVADLQERRKQHEDRVKLKTSERIRDEGNLFRKFVVRVASQHLEPHNSSSGPYPLKSLSNLVRDFREDLGIVRTFFGHSSGIQGRLPDGGTHRPRHLPLDRIDQLIAGQEGEMINPSQPRTSGGLTVDKWFIEALVVSVMGVVGWRIGEAFYLEPLATGGIVAAVAISAGLVSYITLRRRRKPLAVYRRRAETQLIRLYVDVVFAYTGRELLLAVNESFIPRAQASVDSLGTRAEELGAVYGELLSNARARSTEVHPRPRHSVGQIGIDLSAPDIQSADLLDPLVRSIRITPQATEDDRIRDLLIAIGSKDDNSSATGLVGEMASALRERDLETGEQFGAASRGSLDLESIDSAIDGTATTTLAGYLPRTFEGALRQEVGDKNLASLDRHLAAMVHKTPSGTPLGGPDRRRSSLDCNAVDAAVKRMYVPSVDVQALVVQSMQGEGGTLTTVVTQELNEYMGPDGRPLVVPELGTSIVLLSLWVPNAGDQEWAPSTIMGTEEGRRAHDTYYGLLKVAGTDGAISQHDRNFQLLPELSAAAAIELKLSPIKPLMPCVVARLLGSHPALHGPSILGLFYLLRADETIARRSDGRTVAKQECWEIRIANNEVPLVDHSALIGTIENSDPFGSGRRFVSAFDAFMDFMLYDGSPLGAMTEQTGLFAVPSSGNVRTSDWSAIDTSDLADIQFDLVERWWTVGSREDAERDYSLALDVLREDAEAMGGASASDDWLRAVEYVIRSGHEKRLALAPPR